MLSFTLEPCKKSCHMAHPNSMHHRECTSVMSARQVEGRLRVNTVCNHAGLMSSDRALYKQPHQQSPVRDTATHATPSLQWLVRAFDEFWLPTVAGQDCSPPQVLSPCTVIHLSQYGFT